MNAEQPISPLPAPVDAETASRELTLALLFLNRMKEHQDKALPPVWRAWKGYDFDDLDALEEAGFLFGNHRAKSVCFTPEGLSEARRILAKYGIEDHPVFAGEPEGRTPYTPDPFST